MNLIEKIRERLLRYDRTHNFTCDICGRELFTGARLCPACLGELPWNDALICPLCGRKVMEEGICLECKEEPLKTDGARSVLLHEGEAARLVVRFKRGDKFLMHALAGLLLPKLKEFPDADALAFVPMTKKAQRKRGYNQSFLLARELSVRADIPLLDVTVKQKETESQKRLGRKDRRKNLEGCFHVFNRTAVKGRKIVLIDDTLTTGATTSELADVLKRAGAAKVYALTVTSVQNKTPFGLPPLDRA